MTSRLDRVVRCTEYDISLSHHRRQQESEYQHSAARADVDAFIAAIQDPHANVDDLYPLWVKYSAAQLTRTPTDYAAMAMAHERWLQVQALQV